MSSTPDLPIRADHRFLKELMTMLFGTKVILVPSEMTCISNAFVRCGGSWRDVLLLSDYKQIATLTKILKLAYRYGMLTKAEPWLPNEDSNKPPQPS